LPIHKDDGNELRLWSWPRNPFAAWLPTERASKLALELELRLVTATRIPVELGAFAADEARTHYTRVLEHTTRVGYRRRDGRADD
jgi:hypothetical protein